MSSWKPKMDNVPFEIRKRTMQLYGRGHSAKSIAKLMKKSEGYIQEIIRCHRNGRNLHFKINERQEKLIIKMYHRGFGMTTISRYYKTNEVFVSRILKRNGISVRPPESYRKYQLNEGYFDEIDTEEKAYWLGFIMADGCIGDDRMLLVRINKVDLVHLEKLRTALGSDALIREEARDMVNLTVCSRRLASALKKYGVVMNKTFTAALPQLPNNLKRHFIRGYYDGDGCLTVSKDFKKAYISIAGTLDMTKAIQDIWVTEMGLNETKIIPRKSIHVLQYGGRRQSIKIAEWLYRDSTVWLNRKLDKFNGLLAEYKLRETGDSL